HESVVEAAAIGVDDEEFGQRLRAFVVTRDGAEISEDELKGHVKQNLARFKVPREIVFLEELPRNATGKVLKRELAERELADKDGRGDSRVRPPGPGSVRGRRGGGVPPALRSGSDPRRDRRGPPGHGALPYEGHGADRRASLARGSRAGYGRARTGRGEERQ